ncbi:MAG TPA: hypothetical protein VD788_14305 [Candidatus Polarisedimenticolaceae bacterium]|nr:hypothetical protein [Candidatus Polarisedimenticolaceae bacterium]
MSKRIGEILVQRGLLDQEQLEQALNAQLVYGGHLGTCLIERGFVNEDELGQALAETYGVGYASAKELTDVPGPIIECLPRKIVEKHSMIPFRVRNGTLDLALINPKNVEALTEAACTTGFRARAWVAPEIRIYQALERYYGVPRRLRFVALCRELERDPPAEPPARRDRPPRAARPPAAAPDPPPAAREPVYDLGLTPADTGAGVSRDLEDLGAEFGYGQSWQEIAQDSLWTERSSPGRSPSPRSPSVVPAAPRPGLVPTPARASVAPAPPRPVASTPRPAVLPLDAASQRLADARTTDDVASSFLDWAVAGTPRCLLWRVDGLTAILWDWRGFAIDAARRSRLTLKVTEEPVFRLVAGSTCYRGPVPPAPEYRAFFERLGVDEPSEVEVVPLHMDDRLVALFYGDSGTRPTVSTPSLDYRRALLKLGYALWMLRLRQKILGA